MTLLSYMKHMNSFWGVFGYVQKDMGGGMVFKNRSDSGVK